MNKNPFSIVNAEVFSSPALVYSLEAVEENIGAAVAMAGHADRLWPHVKSYKSADLIRLMMKHGIHRFKCATIAEAEMTAKCHADEAVLSYPLVGPGIQRFLRLVQAYPQTIFYAIGDDTSALRSLSRAAEELHLVVNVLVDVDTGLHRTGVPLDRLYDFYRENDDSPGLKLRGFHVYDGHIHQRSPEERQKAVQAENARVFAIRDRLKTEGRCCDTLIMGGTPTFPCHAGYEGVFLSPGTCFVQDYGYASTFRDLPFRIACCILTRVVSHPGKDLMTLDLGYKAVAADPVIPRAVIAGYEQAETILQNEEHLVLKLPEGMERPEIGTVLYAYPIHICPTTILYPEILIARNGMIAESWPVTARNRSIVI